MSKKWIGFLAGATIFTVIIMLPVPHGMSIGAKNAAAVALLMATWWMTETIPIYATAFIPLVAFPFMGVMDARSVAVSYGHDLVLMMISGFFLAKAIEVHNLHKRIALWIVKTLGTNRKRILLSIMLATSLLSMWIANVTSAVLMLPIGLAIIAKDEESQGTGNKFGIALMLGIAFSASIGGTATLIGSPTNLIFSGVMTSMFPDAPVIGFYEWFKVGMPLLIIFFPIVWYYLVRYFRISGNISGSAGIIEQELQSMGKMSKPEKRVAWIFAFTAFGWIFRENIQIGSFTIPGWGEIAGMNEFINDSTVGMFSSMLLFLLPDEKTGRLLDWKSASKIPWGVGVIVGGGYALASGFKVTALADWIGNSLAFISSYPSILVLLIVVGIILVFTEMNPNTATANIFLPILASMAVAGNINPLLLLIPATFASSFVFMLPAGTGPNTVIFGSGRVSASEMAKCGLGLKLISLVLLSLILYLMIIPLLGIERHLPSWAIF